MNLKDLTRPVNSKRVADVIKTQFGVDYKIEKLGLSEAVKLLNKTDSMINEFKHNNSLHESENNASYMKLIMLNEAVSKRANELTRTHNLQESKMNTIFIKALKIAALGGELTEGQLKKLKISENMKSVLRNQKISQTFMRRIIENKKARLTALNEGEIDQAQTTIAAQDIADQIQAMIEKFADIKYKSLPALHDSIRNAQGVDAAQEFNTSVSSSLDMLTGSLETAKSDVNNAVAGLTGQEIAGPNDLDLDDFEGGDDMGMDDDMGMGGVDDMDMDLGLDDNEPDFDLDIEPEVDLGRERR